MDNDDEDMEVVRWMEGMEDESVGTIWIYLWQKYERRAIGRPETSYWSSTVDLLEQDDGSSFQREEENEEEEE